MENEMTWNELEPKVESVLEELKANKAECWPKVFLFGCVAGFFIGTLAVYFITFNFVFYVISFIFGIVGVYIYYEIGRNKIYKAKLMPQIIEAIFPGATYNPKGDMSKSVIVDSHLYDKYLTFRNQDTVRGKVGKTDFIYGEVELSHIESRDKSSKRVVDFKGFVFEADFNKDFNGLTILSSETYRISSRVGLFSSLKRCRLEDVRFEKIYRTYTTDDQQARYILTPSFQERIMSVNRTLASELGDTEMSISFHDSRMLIMVPSEKDRFEAKYNVEDVRQDYLALVMIIDIVNQLNLNLRIWSKE